MYYHPGILDERFAEELKRLNEPDCESAIEILRQRLAFLRDPGFYLKISIENLRLRPMIYCEMKSKGLKTAKNILDCGWKEIGMFRSIGPQALRNIKSLVESIVAHKDHIKGLSVNDIALPVLGK